MSISRIITDIPAGRVKFVRAIIKEDGGTIIREDPEPDGEITIVATFPETPGAELTNAAPVVANREKGSPRERWLATAQAELEDNIAEVDGPISNPRVEAYHATTVGGIEPDSVPWCSSFVNFCVESSGIPGTRSKMARSWLTWGVEARGFVPGCIVVLRRGDPPKGHVGFYVGTENGHIRLLGGNQGNRVSIDSFPADRIIARRINS